MSGIIVGLFAIAAATDIESRTIPNWIAMCIAGATVLRWVDVPSIGIVAADVLTAALVFAGGAVLFRLRVMGGGDVKLLAAAALYLGSGAVGTFLFVTALAGGLLAAVFLLRRLLPRDCDQPTQSLPYGVAIGIGGALTLLGSA